MRRFFQLCGILFLAFVIFSISADTFPGSMQIPERPPVDPPSTPPPVIQDDGPDHATIEYGTPEVIKRNNEPFHAYIRFPQGGNSTDEAIMNWARGLYNEVYAEFQLTSQDNSIARGEINVHFDSYLVDNRYAGIFQNGEYSTVFDPAVPHTEVVKTFNIDLQNLKFLDSNDILDYSQSDSIIELLRNRTIIEHPETERFLGFVDMSWLNYVVISGKGIIVVLDKNRLLPDTFDTLTVTLPYEDLGDALLIRSEPPLETPPTPRPTPTPTPDPEDTTDPDDDDHEGSDDTEPSVPPQGGTIDPSRPIIALTFDDGPGVYTNQFLDLFEQYGVRVTFCTIGNLVKTQETALVRAVSLGHDIIGHSWDHKNLAKLSADAVSTQLTDTFNVIEEVTGTDLKLFRPPYGAVSDTMREVSKELGFLMIYWTVDPEDWNTKDSDEVFRNVMDHVRDGSIILSHEIYKSTLEAYKRLIPELLSHGYQFVTITELLNIRSVTIEPGEVYPMMR